MPDITFSVAGVAKLLKLVDPKKATGPDQVACRLLCELSEEPAPALTLLFKQSYESGKLPSVWKTAWITPVYKKSDKSDAANYRPVSLTCVACKVMEHIICSQIQNHLDKFKFFYPLQHGFRKKLSCESQLLATTLGFPKTARQKRTN